MGSGQTQAGSEKDRPAAQYRHPRPLQKRGPAGRRGFLEELFELLVKTDMGVEAAQESVDQIGTSFRGAWCRWTRCSATSSARSSAPGPTGPADPLCRQRADGHHGGGRERLRQDHLDRQADGHVPGRRQEGRARRGRHVPRRRRRAARPSGPSGWGPRSSPPLRAAIRPAWPIGRSPGPSRRAPTCASSTRPAACKPSRA